jgi:hypothetical protein
LSAKKAEIPLGSCAAREEKLGEGNANAVRLRGRLEGLLKMGGLPLGPTYIKAFKEEWSVLLTV